MRNSNEYAFNHILPGVSAVKIIPAAGADSPRKLQLNNIGTRIFTVSNISNTGGAQSNMTFMNQVTLEQHFDAVQLIFMNNEPSGYQIGDVSIGVSNGSDPNNPVAGSCIPVSFGGITPTAAAPITLPASAGTSVNPDFYLSDIMPISSINRSDGGTLPLLHVRTYIPTTGTNVTLALFGNTTNGALFWGSSPPGGRTWRTRRVAGNLAVTSAGSVPTWTDPKDRGYGVLCGVQYFARGSVVKVMFFGDSTSVGAGEAGPLGVAVTGAGAITRACHAVSDINSLAFQVASGGVSAHTMPEYYSRAVRMIPLFKPDIVIFTATQNSASITQAAVNATSYYTSLAQKLCKDNGALCILTTELANNSADGVSAYTAGQDAFRQAYNAELISRRNKGVLVVDSAGVISAGGLPAPNKAGYTCVGGHAHPNDIGYDAMSVPIAAELLRIKNANL
jgi:hypothetical protein